MTLKRGYWRDIALSDMNQEQWEALCDGCALCCLQKLQDDETEEVYYTDLVCHYINSDCSCSVYETRHEKVPECVWLTKDKIDEFFWLPETCSYRLVSEGKELPNWHPLITGHKKSTKTAGQTVWQYAGARDNQVPEDQWQDRIIFKA